MLITNNNDIAIMVSRYRLSHFYFKTKNLSAKSEVGTILMLTTMAYKDQVLNSTKVKTAPILSCNNGFYWTSPEYNSVIHLCRKIFSPV